MSKGLAVITGASAGIGEVFARRLAVDHDLLLVARRREKLEGLASELSSKHACKIEILQADLSEQKDIEMLADRLAAEPRLTLLVNNAGFGIQGPFWKTDIHEQERMHRLHILATLRLTHAALGGMVSRNAGAIINVASVAAFVRGPGSAGYAATKSWMTAFTEGIMVDLRKANSAVKLQALCPGYTYSEFHDVLGVDRTKSAPKQFWLSAEQVVDDSLKGLQAGDMYVVPGWRYKALVAVLPRLATGLRLALQGAKIKKD